MTVRKLAISGLGGVGAIVVAAATAWACVSGPSVTLSTVNAKPGQEITVTAAGFASSRGDVAVRMDALDGPVFASLKPAASGPTVGPITVPASATPGNHVLIFTQHDATGGLSQMPVRALLTVTPVGGAVPALGAPISAAADRPVGLVTADDSISTGMLLLIGLGVAGVGMFLAGMAALLAGRRAPAPAAVPARQ